MPDETRRINAKDFQESITRELITTKDRVRNLIGSSHWGEDGRYKEAVLKQVISRFLPSNLSIGTGFIVAKDSASHSGVISPQIDIIIYDNSYPVIFREGDLVIVTETPVKAIIEVKTKLDNSGIREAVEKFHFLNEMPILQSKIDSYSFISGLFCYEYTKPNRSRQGIGAIGQGHTIQDYFKQQNVSDCLKDSAGRVNHLVCGKDFFIKYWPHGNVDAGPEDRASRIPNYQRYHTGSLSFSYFISNLLHYVSMPTHQYANTVDYRDALEDRRWFSFPLEEGKESHRIGEPVFLPRRGMDSVG